MQNESKISVQIPVTLFPAWLSLYAPRLQILDISAMDHSEWTSATNYWDIPSLHTLKLTNCPLPWHSLDLSKVTTLVLFCVPASFRQNLVEFLATLGRMQALTVLYLGNALRYILSSGTFSVSPEVALPCLARLSVVASPSTVIALLSCISIPVETQVRLKILVDATSVDDFAELSLVLAQRFNQGFTLALPDNPFVGHPFLSACFIGIRCLYIRAH